ncbi:uncharacterized protein LOC124554038 isoform X2 [Schistocerca americana]|uniref:uncharacterized protein LOC124554038 isoform X2 n=1 Tax=Schistocerca americana TaxID=7009 RepID=UPI001F4F1ED0|nr:uncharacterized protein LOC124554038 isoform X2 [Schistocerca americana]
MVLYKVYFRSQEEREAAIRRIWLMNICRANSIVLRYLRKQLCCTKIEIFSLLSFVGVEDVGVAHPPDSTSFVVAIATPLFSLIHTEAPCHFLLQVLQHCSWKLLRHHFHVMSFHLFQMYKIMI